MKNQTLNNLIDSNSHNSLHSYCLTNRGLITFDKSVQHIILTKELLARIRKNIKFVHG